MNKVKIGNIALLLAGVVLMSGCISSIDNKNNMAPEAQVYDAMPDFNDIVGLIYKDAEKKLEQEEVNARNKNSFSIPLLFDKETGNYSGYRYLFPFGSYSYNDKRGMMEVFVLPLLGGWGYEHSDSGVDRRSGFLLATGYGREQNQIENKDVSIYASLPLLTAYKSQKNTQTKQTLSTFFSLPLMTAWANKRSADGAVDSIFDSLPLLSRWATYENNNKTMVGNNLSNPLVSLSWGNNDGFRFSSVRMLNVIDEPSLLGKYYKSSCGSSYSALGRIFEYDSAAGSSSFSLSPLFARGADSNSSYLTISPLMTRVTSSNGTLSCSFDPNRLWPFYYRAEGGDYTEILWPFYKHSSRNYSEVRSETEFDFSLSSENEGSTNSMNTVTGREDCVSMLGGFLLSDKNSGNLRKTSVGPLGILYSRNQHGEAGEHIVNNVGWTTLYYSDVNRTKNSEAYYVGPIGLLYDHEKKADSVETGIGWSLLYGSETDKSNNVASVNYGPFGFLLYNYSDNAVIKRSVGWSLLYSDDIYKLSESNAAERSTSIGPFGLLFNRQRNGEKVEHSAGWSLLYKSVSDPYNKEYSLRITPFFKYENIKGERSFRMFHFIKI